MSYHHFTTEERGNLLVALTKNLSIREIARQLHYDLSCNSRRNHGEDKEKKGNGIL